MQHIFQYFGDHCKVSSVIPSYDDLDSGLETLDERKTKGVKDYNRTVRRLEIPKSDLETKVSSIKRAAAHLWGGEDQTPDVFQDLEVDSIERIEYANREPLRIVVNLRGGVKKALFAKPFEGDDIARLFGLELENLLSPHKFEYSFGGRVILEDEVAGIEVGEFIKNSSPSDLEDPKYVEELVKLDYRCQVMLLGDMHDANYLVARVEAGGNSHGYSIRPIDFDKLFACFDDQNEMETGVFTGPQIRKEKAIEILGEERYHTIIEFERERMKKRYMENKERIEDLFKIIGSAQALNDTYFGELSTALGIYHNNASFYDHDKAINVGDLLRMHMQKELFKPAA